MEKRRLGRTGHESTVAIFGAAALWDVDQKEADETMATVIEAGVNHIDVAPSYGTAELRLGPWLATHRAQFFLGCKTMERERDAAAAELRGSLERLQSDRFDLFQIHAITSREELDAATRAGGALEAIVEARDEGLVDHIGITGHGKESPALFLEALDRFPFDTVMFPLNYIQMGDATFRRSAEKLLATCQERDVGTMIIKSIARGPWGDKAQSHTTWYEPFQETERIRQAVNYVLSQPVSGLCTAGDTQVLPLVLDACARHAPLTLTVQEALISGGSAYEPLFP